MAGAIDKTVSKKSISNKVETSLGLDCWLDKSKEMEGIVGSGAAWAILAQNRSKLARIRAGGNLFVQFLGKILFIFMVRFPFGYKFYPRVSYP